MSVPSPANVPIPPGCLAQQASLPPAPYNGPYCSIPRFEVHADNDTGPDLALILQQCCVNTPVVPYGNELGPCWVYCPVNQINAQKAYTCLDGLWVRNIWLWNCTQDFQHQMPAPGSDTGNGIEPRPTGGASSMGRWKSRSRGWDCWVLVLLFLAVWL